MIKPIPLVPYSQRKESYIGTCKRCGAFDTHVIESIEGGMICWDLGACNMRRPFPEAKYWDRSMAEII